MRSSLMTIAAASVLLSACEVRKEPGADAGPSTTAPAGAIATADAEKIVADAHSAFTGGDPRRIGDLYAPGAVMFDPAHREPTSDRALQTRWAADFVLMKPGDWISRPTIQPFSADAFVASGIASFTAEVGGNRQLLHTRYSQLFQKQSDGRWLIVHEHMSSPPEAM